MGTPVDVPSSPMRPADTQLLSAVPATNSRLPVDSQPADAQSPDALLTNVLRRAGEHREVGDALAHLVLYDPVTDLPNRILFQDRLNHALAQADRYRRVVALLIVGLGGPEGQRVRASSGMARWDVAEVARQLRRCTRSSDTVARTDEAEFAAILPDVEHGEHAGVVARRILEALAPSYIDGYQADALPVAVGISLYPRDSQDAETLLRNARTAMRHARRNGALPYRFFAHLSVL